MTRGTAYAALEIILWLLAAGAVGLLIGWFLRRWVVDRHVEEQIHALRVDEERRRGKLQLEVAAMEAKAAATLADLERRTADLDRANIQIGERDKAFAAFENQLTEARSKTMKLESKVEDRESTIASLRSSVGKEDKQLAALRKDVDIANGTIGTLRKDADGYRSTIEALRADLDAERRVQKDLAGKLEEAANATAAKETALEAARATQQTLQAQLAELETQTGDTSDMARRLAALKADLEAATHDRDHFDTQLQALRLEHAGCADMSAAVEHPEVREPTSETAAEPEAPDEPTDQTDKEAAVAKVAAIAIRTRGDGPQVDDDLKKIHGVGPKLERLLKSMDITSFRQVANFTTEDIHYVTAALEAFPGRIERDDWMASAAEQHAAKYSEPA